MLDQIKQNVAKQRPRLNHLVRIDKGFLDFRQGEKGDHALILTLPFKHPVLIAFACLVLLYGGYRLFFGMESMLWPAFVKMPTEDATTLYVEALARDNAGLTGGITPLLVTSLESREYTVKKGDTMSKIASDAGVSIDSLISLNNISNVRILQTGQKLLIPNIDGIIHTVASGESLAKIAANYKIKPTAILDANDLTSEKLSVGQKLFIPGAQLSKIDRLKAMGELFVYPVRGYISSYFGYRNDPISGAWSFHTGVDIVGPDGGAVWAAQDGIVRSAGWDAIYGNFVIINHGGGYETLYGHLSKISVYTGQYVKQYGILGLQGSTGWSTGSHVHLTIYKYGSLVNPLLLLN